MKSVAHQEIILLVAMALHKGRFTVLGGLKEERDRRVRWPPQTQLCVLDELWMRCCHVPFHHDLRVAF